ncbi:MAG: aminoglycoside phosphotransferase family protein [Oscillospiraceae bacterium]|nr:aminoglycoside phosphotransferase family protein [Oscillospiraceae bacterium]
MRDEIYRFPIDGRPARCDEIRSGHVNTTYLITTDTGARYILQNVNTYAFPRTYVIMDNISAISLYLAGKSGEKSAMISYIDTLDGERYYDDGQGGAWRIYRFVENSICLDRAACDEDFCECARAFGKFQNSLVGFPAEKLGETIVDFHNTPVRYRQLREAAEADVCGRLEGVREELAFVLEREEKAFRLQRMRDSGELPVRVTHNDTKINNVLFDADTRKAICVIDLDTVMPGLSAYDFGDAIRFGASTAAEDEKDLDKVELDLHLFRVFARGFLEACPSLTEKEIACLPLGAYTMTIECGSRFLADYLKGDKYFSIDYPAQNLDRARTQFKLIRDMEKKWDEMQRIIEEERKKLL